MADTVNVNIIDRSVPIGNHKNIAVINQPNPAMNVDVNARELYLLINNPSYFITDSETRNTINGVNYYEYFPEASPGGGGGGGSKPKLISKNITENGVYNASSDNADGYKSVDVNVPNTYALSDEGKVVHNNELISQTSSEVTDNGIVDTTLISSLNVNVSGGGGGLASPKDVNFYDYDGTIVHSYTAAEFAELTTMPENPSHDGLTAQGWNWSLTDAKTYVSANSKLDIGQMYTTADGKTYIHIVLEDGRLKPILGLGLDGSVDIDWGDGTEHTTLTGTNVNTYISTSPHTYATPGAYTIKLSVTGSMAFVHKNSVCGLLMKSGYNSDQSACYRNAIKSIYVGTGITSIGIYAFYGCYSLSSVTIPSSVISIENNAFRNCSSLSSVTIPSSVISIGSYVFNSCYSLSDVIMPHGVTSILSDTFSNCYSLSSVIIPSSVTSIGSNVFYSCYGFGKITFESATPPTIQTSTFSNIPTDCKIYVPTGSLSLYTSAQYYPSSSTYTYVEY